MKRWGLPLSLRAISMRAERQGFTLIELVIGMLVLSIAIVLLTSVLFPQSDRAAATLQRVRASELAGSVLNEIWGKAYDENSGFGGVPACGSNDGISCSTVFGSDGENRNDYDDVDDYNDLKESAEMLNSSQTYAAVYPDYKLLVTVEKGNKANTKLITVKVKTPAGEVIQFNALRSNY
ncbi:type II secretion system protein [Shewanella sp. 4t3-1-2LB]|uniref:type IV pilus modification PilV family protein n=1 Tax=Shewanella sp. 4t3-1-2LB TaxID=2817682 RepID=UPI001A98768B|nr:type II secretion system protein [Shewanella sp. 4t3-1-2LB]MBO1270631.1 type II secretion system protein [Shewanella sp. 4t3-1-2LB]